MVGRGVYRLDGCEISETDSRGAVSAEDTS